ncbi:MAG TPA: HDIG domain-containing protein, partial [Planctomycetes bacterium]|nr:HDIG domain-containing protein [Planctomycetota bacterium]
EKITTAIQDYRVLTLLLVALFAILLLMIAVQSWRTGFAFREGQVWASGVQSRVEFKIEDTLATKQARMKAEAGTRLVFVQNNELWNVLESTFKNDLTAVANARTLSDVPADVIMSYGLDMEFPGDVEKGTTLTTRFDNVQTAFLASDMAIGDLLNQMGIEFSRLLNGVRGVGILDDTARAAIGLPDDDLNPPIEIVDPSGEAVSFNLLVDVTLEDQLLETGSIGGAFGSLSNLLMIKEAVKQWLRVRLVGQLSYNESLTAEHRRKAVEKVAVKYNAFPAGRILVPTGTLIGPDHLAVLNEEYLAHEMQLTFTQRLVRIAGSALMLTVMVILFGIYLWRSERHLLDETGQLLAFVMICGAAVFLGCLLSRDPWRAEALPLLGAVMIVAIVHNQMLAILTAFCLSLMITMSTVSDLGHFAVLMTLCFTLIIPLRSVSSRLTMIKLGFILAAVAFVAVWGISLLSSPDFADGWRNPAILIVGLKFAFWSLVCCYVVGGSLPFIESAFGIVTDISLLELTDVSHPLLQELARRAPGTYNHSISVATIGEAAADAIGANGLLVRVGAYFHDIGKMLKPEYFIENMAAGEENPHDNLAPAMSALIIIGHVKDGAEMAEQHNLPRRLIDFIEQHHGTTLVEYFYREAANRADEDHRTDADESTFRYPGPRPQSKEAGVMMLADAVESASRTLSEPAPKRIQSLVNEITLKRVLDGQFDECGLTMIEIRVVQESLVKTLLAVHHGRVKYPGQKTG